MAGVEGVVLDRVRTDMLGPGETLRPLRDHIVVKPLAWRPSAIVDIAGDTRKPLRGTVVAVGPGCYPKRYNSNRSKCWDSAVFRPTQVRVGDVVELGGLELGGYRFPQILIGTEMHVICREEDVTGVACSE